MALAKLPRPGDREMLLALIIGAAAVVAIICSFAMFLQYMREAQTMTATQTLRRRTVARRPKMFTTADGLRAEFQTPPGWT